MSPCLSCNAGPSWCCRQQSGGRGASASHCPLALEELIPPTAPNATYTHVSGPDFCEHQTRISNHSPVTFCISQRPLYPPSNSRSSPPFQS